MAEKTKAEELALMQKEISVSEFFAKNRHLLGFDNPRKALLMAVKEGVDNPLLMTGWSSLTEECLKPTKSGIAGDPGPFRTLQSLRSLHRAPLRSLQEALIRTSPPISEQT